MFNELRVTFSFFGKPAALGAALALGACAGPQATMPSAQMDFARTAPNCATAAGGQVKYCSDGIKFTGQDRFEPTIRIVPNTRRVAWGVNHFGFIDNGAYRAQASVEGCWRVADALITDTRGIEYSLTIVPEPGIQVVGDAGCQARSGFWEPLNQGLRVIRDAAESTSPYRYNDRNYRPY